jgi:hypothetical protein
MKAIVRLAAILPLVTVLASCSIGYHRKWTKSADETLANPPKDLAGAWEGTWRSASDGHTGRLRAIAIAVPAAGNRKLPIAYDFHYEATWKTVLSACITARHTLTHPYPKKPGEITHLTGEKDLGALGGVFRFTGTATPGAFHADYTSNWDHGVFEMKRPSQR